MARVSQNFGAPPQIGHPVGSVQELKDLGVPTRNIRTCSESDGNKNGGCPVWHLCDRSYRGDRPQMEVIRKVNSEGKIRVYQAPCYDTILKESVASDNHELYDVIGHEGDEYTYRGSVKKHPVRDANCNACVQGKCEAYVDRNDLKAICAHFPPAAEHPELQMFAERVRARTTTGVRAKEAVRDSLLPGSEPGKKINVAKGAGSGSGS